MTFRQCMFFNYPLDACFSNKASLMSSLSEFSGRQQQLQCNR